MTGTDSKILASNEKPDELVLRGLAKKKLQEKLQGNLSGFLIVKSFLFLIFNPLQAPAGLVTEVIPLYPDGGIKVVENGIQESKT